MNKANTPTPETANAYRKADEGLSDWSKRVMLTVGDLERRLTVARNALTAAKHEFERLNGAGTCPDEVEEALAQTAPKL